MEDLTPVQKELYDWLVQYINTNKYSPSIREMMKAMNLRSPAPIQSRLDKMRKKGYLQWSEGQARTLKILKNDQEGLPLRGKIKGGEMIELGENDKDNKINFAPMFLHPDYFVLQMADDSLREDNIKEGDYLIMSCLSPQQKLKNVKNERICLVKSETGNSSLKKVSFVDDNVILKSSNDEEKSLNLSLKEVEIQGVLFASYRLHFSLER